MLIRIRSLNSIKSREVERKENQVKARRKKINKQKLSKCLRNLGQEYVSLQGKTVASRGIKPRCKEETCKKLGRLCSTIDDSQRCQIFNGYYALGDINRQREFIIHHCEVTDTKQKISKSEVSRRQQFVIFLQKTMYVFQFVKLSL